ncbi:MAG: UMP kinase [Chlamydiia bacterium]|nr:UMP kinase [Chlamydiia bacterium]
MYRRVLLKLSGEMLLVQEQVGIEQAACDHLAKILKGMQEEGFQVCVVIGGGNLFRGVRLSEKGVARTPADQMGMLATLMNGVALEQALHGIGAQAVVMSALQCPQVAETYQWERAQKFALEGKIVIFVGGTGNPYFTTDTAAALRACEMEVDLLVKATKVDGIYAADPLLHTEAERFESMSYMEILQRQLGVMDNTAIALCLKENIPLFVMNMNRLGTRPFRELLTDRSHGTMVS